MWQRHPSPMLGQRSFRASFPPHTTKALAALYISAGGSPRPKGEAKVSPECPSCPTAALNGSARSY